MPRETLRFPKLLSPLFSHPRLVYWIVGGAAVHLALTSAYGIGFGCLIHDITGLPCPGCGLTAASMQILRGNWSEGIAIHPFAPIFLLVVVLLAVTAVLPSNLQRSLAARAAQMEVRHNKSICLSAGLLLLYWIFRMIFP